MEHAEQDVDTTRWRTVHNKTSPNTLRARLELGQDNIGAQETTLQTSPLACMHITYQDCLLGVDCVRLMGCYQWSKTGRPRQA